MAGETRPGGPTGDPAATAASDAGFAGTTIVLRVGGATDLDIADAARARDLIARGVLRRDNSVTVYRAEGPPTVARAGDVPELTASFATVLGPGVDTLTPGRPGPAPASFASVNADLDVSRPAGASPVAPGGPEPLAEQTTPRGPRHSEDFVRDLEKRVDALIEQAAAAPVVPAAPVSAAPTPSRSGPWSAPSTPPAPSASSARPESLSPAPVSYPAAPPVPRPTIVQHSAPADASAQPPAPARLRVRRARLRAWPGTLLRVALVLAFFYVAQRLTGGTPFASDTQVHARAGVNVRSSASVRTGAIVGQVDRDEALTGRFVTTRGGERWFRITQGPYRGDWAWGPALSRRARPPLEGSPRALRLRAPLALRSEPDDAASATQVPSGARLRTVGTTPDGWVEIAAPGIGIAYARADAVASASR